MKNRDNSAYYINSLSIRLLVINSQMLQRDATSNRVCIAGDGKINLNNENIGNIRTHSTLLIEKNGGMHWLLRAKDKMPLTMTPKFP